MSVIDNFDSCKTAIINPSAVVTPYEEKIETIIVTFSHKIIDAMIEDGLLYEIGLLKSVCLRIPLYIMKYKNHKIGIMMTIVGAAGSVGFLEEAIVFYGCRNIIVFGSCGVLDKSIESGTIIVPTKAYRDEGTSYHYVSNSDYIEIKNSTRIAKILTNLNIKHILGAVWTTDAIYRETISNMNRRKNEGCIAVDMELSAHQALCDFREINLYQFIYSADNLDSINWEMRCLLNLPIDERLKYMYIAIELATEIK